tara:strand:- start:3842 stop:6592 length:2751 start_codon:yes stop_codon:yes gene_type:complete
MSGPFGSSEFLLSTNPPEFYDYEIEKSLSFYQKDGSTLTRTISANSATSTNGYTHTWAAWVQMGSIGSPFGSNPPFHGLFQANIGSGSTRFGFEESSSNSFPTHYFTVMNSTIRRYGNGASTSSSAYGGNKSHGTGNVCCWDTGGWFHVCVVFDAESGGGIDTEDAFRWYINGVRLPGYGAYTNVDYYSTYFASSGSDATHTIGYADKNETYEEYFCGRIADVHWVDGLALTPASFTETKHGVLVPKEYTGSYGNAGYHLEFKDSSDIGKDTSGNNNDFTANNLNQYNILPDTPTSTFNKSVASIMQGNRYVFDHANHGFANEEPSGVSHYRQEEYGQIPLKTGKWYWEVYVKSINLDSTDREMHIGVTTLDNPNSNQVMQARSAVAYIGGNDATTHISGYKSVTTNGTNVASSYGAAYADATSPDDIIGVALDCDGGTVTFYKNNASQGSITLPLANQNYHTFFRVNPSNYDREVYFNFGQDDTFHGQKTSGSASATAQGGVGTFYYTPPSGHKAIHSKNLTPAVDPLNEEKPEDFFKVVKYTGNGTAIGSGGNTVTVGFQPDIVIIKEGYNSGSNTPKNVVFYDSVRGATKKFVPEDELSTNGNLATSTRTETTASEGLTSFTSTGFTLGNDTDTNNNSDDDVYFAYCWKIGGSSSSNSDGTITATVLANQTLGISIIKYTGNGTAGATIGHGLDVAPQYMIMCNLTDAGEEIHRYHASFSSTGASSFSNFAEAYTSTANITNSTAPSSSVITLGDANGTNKNSSEHVIYAFAEKEGFSRIGGNLGFTPSNSTYSTVPNHLPLGFKPALVIFSPSGNDSSATHFNSPVFGSDVADLNLSSLSTTNKYGVPMIEGFGLHKYYHNMKVGYSANTHLSHKFDSSGYTMLHRGLGNMSTVASYFVAFAEMPYKFARSG